MKNTKKGEKKPKPKPRTNRTGRGKTQARSRRRPNAGSKFSIKDLLINTLVGAGGAIVANMVSTQIIKAKPDPANAKDPTGELRAAKLRALIQIALGGTAIYLGKKNKMIGQAGIGSAVVGGVNAIKSFAPGNKFLGEEIGVDVPLLGEQYSIGEEIRINADEFGADEFGAEFGADEFGADEFGEEFGF